MIFQQINKQTGVTSARDHLHMKTLVFLPFALFAYLNPAAAMAQDASCAPSFLGGQPPALTNSKLEQRTTMLCNDAYAVLASGVTHGALWSAEHLTRASLEQARQMRRRGEFHAEDRLPPGDQAQLADYRRSGFDRGHMTPSGDAPDEMAQQQTFSLANVVPQTAELNRGVWEGVETAVRDLAGRDGELYVVTGPAFYGEQLQSIGPGGVLVPSSTWKAIYDPRTGGAGVYVCKNTETPSCDAVSVAVLIQAVNVDPFPALSDSVKQVTMTLPPPEDSPYAPKGRTRYRRQERSFLQQLLNP